MGSERKKRDELDSMGSSQASPSKKESDTAENCVPDGVLRQKDSNMLERGIKPVWD